MPSLIDIMVERGLVARKDLEQIMSAGNLAEPPHRVAVRSGLVSEDDFLGIVGEELGLEFVAALPQEYDPGAFGALSVFFMEEHCFLPLAVNGEVRIAVSDPFDYLVMDTLKKVYPGKRVRMFLAREEQIRSWIRASFRADEEDEEEKPEEEAGEPSIFLDEDLEQLRDLASEAPIIKKVNYFLTKAVEVGASDIHIEPFADRFIVRFRVDGILLEFDRFPKHLQQGVVTRIKIMAQLDIAERRIPQDGRIRIKVAGKSIDLRVSCLPTMYGESVVMRILDRTSITFSLDTLGFPPREFELFNKLILAPYGIILVTGPTGSGKTTTLYSALNTINSVEKKIITIEDPVEYELDGINQVQVNSKAGLTFAGGLRSIVRQDPDVILIGEIRDRETADIAIQSALTGHLVFSTLHTNDSASAVARLLEIGVEDYLLTSSVIGIMAQRLVRVLCPKCREAFVPDQAIVSRLQLSFVPTDNAPIYRPRGCEHCSQTGYKGRLAIFELLLVTDEIRELILENRSSVAIRNKALENGMVLLRGDGWNKVRTGQTSIEEVLRVTGA
ncbi:MAG: type II secretion system protein GspE [Verrucomicrobiae bacterium]|nr:type II secretion system protein GspE [Verrucomicrobiae bacterium]